MSPAEGERLMAGRNDLIRRFTGMRAAILGYLRVLVRDPHLAEDLFQETCLVVLRKIDTFDDSGDLGAWVRTIAFNLARNARRKERHFGAAPSPDVLQAIERAHAGGSDAEDEAQAARLERLSQCLKRVDPRQRELLNLRYAAGASLGEIAHRTGRTAGAVQVALTRLRQFLLRCIRHQDREMSHEYEPA